MLVNSLHADRARASKTMRRSYEMNAKLRSKDLCILPCREATLLVWSNPVCSSKSVTQDLHCMPLTIPPVAGHSICNLSAQVLDCSFHMAPAVYTLGVHVCFKIVHANWLSKLSRASQCLMQCSALYDPLVVSVTVLAPSEGKCLRAACASCVAMVPHAAANRSCADSA